MAAAAVREGYGGQFHEYATGYGRNGLTVPPNVPKEYGSLTLTDNSTKFLFWKEVTVVASRGPVGWQPMNSINDVHYPVGWHNLDKDGVVGRCLGYVPGPALGFGLMHLYESIEMIYTRVICNQNSITEIKDETHSDGKSILRTVTTVPVELCASQRFVILLNAIALFIRSLIETAQLGWLFYPADELAGRS